ncbi:MAG TPA: SDR family oxidoreductase [Candidatus Acidoferrales bacterium]|nr:SDR family oxidoreductase [Candidatus Acidoferrales bacterium]
MSALLSGEHALITGVASGIGRGMARALHAEGAQLAVVDIDAERGGNVASEVGATFIQADLSTEAGARVAFEEATKALGTISIFVHSASPPRRESQTVLAVTGTEWDAMVNTNLRSGFILGQAIAKHMIAEKVRGKMLFVTSLHANSPRNLPHYSAAKAGETMLVKEFARALGPHGIRVNAIAPGAIPGGGFAADVSALESMIALGRTGTPEDIASMAVALLSDRFSGYVTGTTVVVDGGLALYNWIPASAPIESP